MKAMGDNQANASPRETPRRRPPDSRAAQPSETSKPQGREAAAIPPDADERPTPPRLSRLPKTSDAPPQEAPAAPPRARITRKLSEPAPEPPLADLNWMPPAENRVAQFLHEVADIAPPTPTREGAPPPGFVLPAAISPEEAERKKTRAEPFWSQVVATPMEQPAPMPPARPRRGWSKRRRRRLWLMLAAALLLLVIAGLAVLLYTHLGLLPLK